MVSVNVSGWEGSVGGADVGLGMASAGRMIGRLGSELRWLSGLLTSTLIVFIMSTGDSLTTVVALRRDLERSSRAIRCSWCSTSTEAYTSRRRTRSITDRRLAFHAAMMQFWAIFILEYSILVIITSVKSKSGASLGQGNDEYSCKWVAFLSRECGGSELGIWRGLLMTVLVRNTFPVKLHLTWLGFWVTLCSGSGEQMTLNEVWNGVCSENGKSKSFTVTRLVAGRTNSKEYLWVSCCAHSDQCGWSLCLMDTTVPLAHESFRTDER